MLLLSSSIFQAAIVFLHNAKGENEFVKEQGRQHLLRCSKVYLGDPYLKNTRVVKVLQSLVMNFDVQMDDSSSYRSSTNSPDLNQNIGIRAERNDSDESDDAQHNSFLMKTMIDSNRYNTSEASPNAKNLSTFTVTTGHIPGSQGSVKSSSDSSYRETTPTIPNPFPASLHLGGTRPEDMFFSSLSMNFANNRFKQQQQSTDASPNMAQPQPQPQPQHEQQDQSMNMDFEKNCVFQNADGSEMADPILCPNMAGLQHGSGLGDGQCSLAFDSQQQQHQRYPTASSTSTANTTSEPNYTTPCQQPQHSANTFLGIYNMEPISQQQPAQFDLTSLSSQVPLWDVPSGVTWNEWESFLKTNVDATNAST